LHLKTTRYSDLCTSYSFVCNVIRENSSAGLLVEFHQHATEVDVTHRRIVGRPNTVTAVSFVEGAYAAIGKPPTAIFCYGAAATRPLVIVAVWSTEHLSVGCIIMPGQCNHHGVAGVSTVPGHRQAVLTNLVTDGERRVFIRVPQTRSTLDLLTDTRDVATRCIAAYKSLTSS